MKRINAHGRIREYVYVAAFLLLFAVMLAILYALPQAEIIRISETNGSCDFTQNNFNDTNYLISKGSWESWPEKLYTPADLTNENITGQPRILDVEEYKTLRYATHRLRLNLPPGRIYGIKLTSSDFSMRLYINGEEIDSVGVPGETRETTVPRVQNRVYYFVAGSGETELVVQAANFVHATDGAWPPDFYIGSQENITRQNNISVALSFVIVGYLLTAFFDHLGLFCLNRKRKTTLIFALSCLLLALMNKSLVMMFFPEYNWFIGIRIEYIVHFLIFAALTLFLDMLYPKLLNKIITRAYYALAGIYILFTLLTDTLFFTSILEYFEYISIALIAYILVRLAMNLKSGGIGNFLSFFGALVLSLTAINDILYYRGIQIIDPIAGQFFLSPLGMSFFVFCSAMVVSVEYVDTETALMNERRQSDTLAINNATLDRLNRMKTEMIAVVTHETMTPLAVLSGYAELVAKELRRKGVDEQTAKDLDNIAEETQRISWLMDELQSHTREQDSRLSKTRLNLTELINGAARLYTPILERKNIKLTVHIPEKLSDVYACASEITQVLFNLLQNARNHTENGKVTIAAAPENDYIIVTVSDTGNGIPPELLPHVFEHGVSGSDSGTGLGLHICKEIIEGHGSVIEIKSEQHKGTSAKFTLPVWKEGLNLEQNSTIG